MTTMISDVELGMLRTESVRVMPSTATVLRLTATPDTQGGTTNTYAAIGTYPCSLTHYPIRPVERESQPRIQLVALWNFKFPIAADIQSTDRLLLGARTFEVVDAGLGSQDLSRHVICLEIT